MALFSRIREINQKFRVPHVKMTRGVKLALLLLRIYLLLLIANPLLQVLHPGGRTIGDARMPAHESSTQLPRFFFITQLIRDKVLQEKGEKRMELGNLMDLEIRLSGRYPEVVNLIVGRSFGRPPLEVPFRYVKTIDTRRTVVELPAGVKLKEFDRESARILVKDMVLDKKIIDTDEYEVEIVYDIHLLHAEGRMLVVHVDVTKAGMLRRLHFGWLARLLWGEVKNIELLPWKYVQPLPTDIDRFHGNVKLTVSREKIADIHPADLADILEELSGDERMAVFNTLDTETAADTLEEAEPRVQRELVASLRHDRLAELFLTMTPAQIADILEILPRVDAEALKKSLPAETGGKGERAAERARREAALHRHGRVPRAPGDGNRPPGPRQSSATAHSATTSSCTCMSHVKMAP